MSDQHAPADPPFEVNLIRHFNTTRERVFDAWTNAAMLREWWGPDEYTNPECEIDAQPGGLIHIMMRDTDGRNHQIGGVMHTVEPPSRLEFTSTAFYNEQGEHQLECYNTITFAEHGGQTEVTVNARVVYADPAITPVIASLEITWTQSLECLDSLLKT